MCGFHGRGGALETVVENETGLFFYKQNHLDIIDTIKTFLKTEDKFDPVKIRENAKKFPRSRFEREFKEFVDKKWEEFPYKR